MARDEEGVLLLDEFDFIRGEESHGDAVVVVANPLDVVGRPVRRRFAARLVEHVEQPVKADGRAVERRKVVGSHGHILRRATWNESAGYPPAPDTQAFTALGRQKNRKPEIRGAVLVRPAVS